MKAFSVRSLGASKIKSRARARARARTRGCGGADVAQTLLSVCLGLRSFKCFLVVGALLVALPSSGAPVDLAIRGGVVYTMDGSPIRDGVVLVSGGRIVAAGAAADVAIPSGTRTLTAAVVTPGLIDAHTVVGLAGYLNQAHDQDQLEGSEPLQPELRAIDAYNARETLVAWLRGFGITTIHTGHAPGALVSGQTMIAKTVGDTVDQAVMVPLAMVAVTLGESALAEGAGKSPGTRAKQVAMLRKSLIQSQEYKRKLSGPEDKKPERDLRLETLVRVLDREIRLLVTAQRAQEIVSALRIAGEFSIRIVLDGAAEAYELVDEIRAAGFPVILHPTMERASGETKNASFETASVLHAKGIAVALQSGYENYVPKTRVVLFEAAIAAANGLGFDGALSSITIDAAKILGVDGRVGSISVGKDADFALFDGDPFEYTTHVTAVVIDGTVVSEEIR